MFRSKQRLLSLSLHAKETHLLLYDFNNMRMNKSFIFKGAQLLFNYNSCADLLYKKCLCDYTSELSKRSRERKKSSFWASQCDSSLKQSEALIKVLVKVCVWVQTADHLRCVSCETQHYIRLQILLEAFVLQYTIISTLQSKYDDLTYKWKYDSFHEMIKQSPWMKITESDVKRLSYLFSAVTHTDWLCFIRLTWLF